MNKHPSACDSGVQAASWDGTCQDLRILLLSSSLMIGKGTELQFPVIPYGKLCSGYSLDTPCVTNSHGAPDQSHSQTFGQTRLHVSHLIFWEEKVTGVKLGRHWNPARAGCSRDSSPLGHGQHHSRSVLSQKHWAQHTESQRVIFGAHFRGLLCQFTQMTLCKTGDTSTQKSSSRRKLEWVCLCNICKSVTLHASPQLVHFILNAEAVLRS